MQCGNRLECLCHRSRHAEGRRAGLQYGHREGAWSAHTEPRLASCRGRTAGSVTHPISSDLPTTDAIFRKQQRRAHPPIGPPVGPGFWPPLLSDTPQATAYLWVLLWSPITAVQWGAVKPQPSCGQQRSPLRMFLGNWVTHAQDPLGHAQDPLTHSHRRGPLRTVVIMVTVPRATDPSRPRRQHVLQVACSQGHVVVSTRALWPLRWRFSLLLPVSEAESFLSGLFLPFWASLAPVPGAQS